MRRNERIGPGIDITPTVAGAVAAGVTDAVACAMGVDAAVGVAAASCAYVLLRAEPNRPPRMTSATNGRRRQRFIERSPTDRETNTNCQFRKIIHHQKTR